MTKATLIAAIASTAIAGIISLADKRMKEVDADKAAIKRGYEAVTISKMACEGLRAGEFCITDRELSVSVFSDDLKDDAIFSTTTYYIYDKVKCEAEVNLGFYAVMIEGKIRKAFFDGSNLNFLAGADRIKVSKQLDISSEELAKEIKELRKQYNRTTELESEVKILKKKLETLETKDAKDSKKHKDINEKTLA